MASNNLLNVIRDVDPTHIERAILPSEASHAAHIISVIRKLVAAEAVDVRVEDIGNSGKAVQVLAILALGADATSEVETEVRAGVLVGASVA
jgi:hypothetical protein